MAQKPRVRRPAGSSIRQETTDTYRNFRAGLGYGSQNLLSGSTYGYNPITRNHILLEWMYRGSWLVRKLVDAPANDMTREGIQIESEMLPEDIDKLTKYWLYNQIWQRLRSSLKWARLYGGCIAAIMIDGQKPDEPLRIETVGKGQFKGLLVLDRWMVWPNLEDLVEEFGPEFGKPKYYEVSADARAIPNMRLHYSRCLRFDGIELPYWQALTENLWGLSILEPMFDRIVAWDSVSTGAAQLVYKAHLRTLKIPQYREIIAQGGRMFQSLQEHFQMLRLMQSNEGLTVIDSEDEFDVQSYGFGGLSDMMLQFAQQMSGAGDVPMTRLFGQSPGGLNSTGESDLRNYYDMLRGEQESVLRVPVTKLLSITHRSLFGRPLPEDFNYTFSPLWQLTAPEKVQMAVGIAQAVDSLSEGGIFSSQLALKEIRQSSRATGFGTNITDEDIKAAENAPPTPEELLGHEGFGGENHEELHGVHPEGNENIRTDHPAAPKPKAAVLKPHDGEAQDEPNPNQEVTEAILNQAAESTLVSPVKWFSDPEKNRHKLPPRYHNINPEDMPSNPNNIGVVQPNDPFPAGSVVPGSPRGMVVGVKGEGVLGKAYPPPEPAKETAMRVAHNGTGLFHDHIGPNPDHPMVYVVEQVDPHTGLFDGHKVMRGYQTKDEAIKAYKQSFKDNLGEVRISTVRTMAVDAVGEFLAQGE